MIGKGGYLYLDLRDVDDPTADPITIDGIYDKITQASGKPVFVDGYVGVPVYGFATVLAASGAYYLTTTAYETTSEAPILATYTVDDDDAVSLALTLIPEEEAET